MGVYAHARVHLCTVDVCVHLRACAFVRACVRSCVRVCVCARALAHTIRWMHLYDSRLPPSLTGASFLASHNSHGDAVTTVDPDRSYAVREAARHPVMEHFRVRAFQAILSALTSSSSCPSSNGGSSDAADESQPCSDCTSTPHSPSLALLGQLMLQVKGGEGVGEKGGR